MWSSIARAKGVQSGRGVDDGKTIVAVRKSSDCSFPLGVLGRRRKQAGVASVELLVVRVKSRGLQQPMAM